MPTKAELEIEIKELKSQIKDAPPVDLETEREEWLKIRDDAREQLQMRPNDATLMDAEAEANAHVLIKNIEIKRKNAGFLL